MNIPRVLWTVTLLEIFGVGVAQAEFTRTTFLNQCSSGAIRTCASFQTETYRYLSSGAWRTQVYIRVRNLAAILSDGRFGGSTINRLGVLAPRDLLDVRFENALNDGYNRGGTAPIFVEEGAVTQGDPAPFWSTGNSNVSSLGRVEFAVSSRNPVGGINDCIGPNSLQIPPKGSTPTYYRTCGDGAPSGWVTFAFTSASEFTDSQMQIAWGAVSVKDPLSPNEDLGSYQGETCLGCGTTDVVPEPVSVILLGSGLLGVGGVRLIRRSHRNQDVP